MKNTSPIKTELRVKSPLISVIIPVFNVEEYLEECISSILRQTLTDIEIICIDDGSTDSSPDILKKYAEQDRRITVYSQDNCGLSAARNLGMRAARGRYTYFIDSDDWLERDALRDLYTRAEKDQLDLLLFDADAFADDPSLNTAVETQKDYYISICVLCLLYGVPVSMYSSPGIHRMSAKPVRSIYGDRLNESGIFMLQDEKRHLPDPGDGVF